MVFSPATRLIVANSRYVLLDGSKPFSVYVPVIEAAAKAPSLTLTENWLAISVEPCEA